MNVFEIFNENNQLVDVYTCGHEMELIETMKKVREIEHSIDGWFKLHYAVEKMKNSKSAVWS